MIYIDEDCRCRTAPVAGLREIETDAFDGKCKEYIEGYRYVPAGETWTREDGEVFSGEMITPWKEHAQLAQCQTVHERMLAQQAGMQAEAEELKAQNAKYESALTEIEAALGVIVE